MKIYLPIRLLFLFCILFVSCVYVPSAKANLLSPVAKSVQINASVGEFYMDLSGSIAPYASVVLISNNIVLRSTVADANGYWYISQILIQQGFSSFCLDAIDYKRLGESYTCFSVTPATENIVKQNIFLPPTLGLQKKTVDQGGVAIAWGYTMRGGTVTLHLSDGRVITVNADSEGFYEVHAPVPAAGTYELFADATYHGASSLKPDRNITLTVLSVGQQVINRGKGTVNQVGKFLIGTPWGFLWLIIPILILIIILLKKLKPEWFTWMDGAWNSVHAYVPFMHRKLHHHWMKGVGY